MYLYKIKYLWPTFLPFSEILRMVYTLRLKQNYTNSQKIMTGLMIMMVLLENVSFSLCDQTVAMISVSVTEELVKNIFNPNLLPIACLYCCVGTPSITVSERGLN